MLTASKSRCLILLLVLGFVVPLFAQDDPPLLELLSEQLPSNRVTVAMVPLANATGDPSLDYWRYAAMSLLAPHLAHAKGMRLLPHASLKYALAQLQKKQGDPLDSETARKLGELIEAQRVVWGTYSRDAGKWSIALRVLKVADGTSSDDLTAASSDLFDLRDNLSKALLKKLKVKPTAAEQKRMKARWTKSAAVVESLAQARAALEQKRTAAELESFARRALAADADCAEAWAILAASTGTLGKIEEALNAAQRAVKLNHELGLGHAALGQVLLVAQRTSEAEEPLEKAMLLDPDNPAPIARLAECRMIARELPDAISYFKKALQLSPFQASLHANLGRAYLLQGERDRGSAELKEAERLTFEPDLNSEEFLAWGYERLNNTPAAISHYEEALSIAKKVGLNPERIKELSHDMEKLKAAMVPSFLKLRPPKDYTEEGLTAAFHEKLDAVEMETLVRPLASTPEMRLEAIELTRDSTNSLQKARMLFDALAGHLNAGEHELRTASETFAVWKKKRGAFSCQEYAFLYTMWARSLGLRAYFVTVDEACDGQSVSHACAVVFDGDKSLLVDPGYRWFGVPHKKFNVLDDLEATAEYLSQSSDLRLRRIAVKLNPDSVYARFKLASKLFVDEQWEESRKETAEVIRRNGDGPFANCLQAMLALHDDKTDEAIVFARKALDHGWPPHDGFIYMFLGGAYYKQGKLIEAREAFRTLLSQAPDEKSAQAARRAIARINFALGGE